MKFYLAKISVVFAVLAFPILSFGQEENPILSASNKEIVLGKAFELSLSWKHAADLDVFFPRDKSHFYPYMLIGLKPLETVTENGISKDEVVYQLMTFEVEPEQTISLPVWYIENGDSLRLVSNVDTLLYTSIIADSLLSTSDFQWTPEWLKAKKGNYNWTWLKWLSITLLILGIMVFVMRKTIERKYLTWQFSRKQQDFALKFRRSMKDAEDLSTSVALWKEHMEWLDKIPYTTLSSSEITLRTKNERLGEALKKVDAAIYGGEESEQLLLALQILYNESTNTFRLRKKEFIKSLKNK